MDHSFTTEIPVLDVQDHHIGVYHYGTKYHTIIPLWYQIYSIHYGTNSFWSNFVIVVRVCRWLNPDVSSHSWWNPPSINKYFRYNDMIWGYKYTHIYICIWFKYKDFNLPKHSLNTPMNCPTPGCSLSRNATAEAIVPRCCRQWRIIPSRRRSFRARGETWWLRSYP